jgi:hypothetical protein
MAADEYPDPLQYLNRVERVLVGWSARRLFETNVPRTARWIRSSGPHAVARVSCAQTFALYIWVFVLPGVVFDAVGLSAVATVLFTLGGVCGVWAFACAISGIKPQREYRSDHRVRDTTG